MVSFTGLYLVILWTLSLLNMGLENLQVCHVQECASHSWHVVPDFDLDVPLSVVNEAKATVKDTMRHPELRQYRYSRDELLAIKQTVLQDRRYKLIDVESCLVIRKIKEGQEEEELSSNRN